MTARPLRTKWSRTTKLILTAVICLALYAVLGFFVVPLIIRSQLESKLTEQLNHPVTMKEVRFNPFALSLTVRDFDITEQDQAPLLGFEELYVNVQLSSIINRALTFSTIRLLHPYAVVRIRKDGSLNLADLRPAATEQPAEPPPPEPKDAADKSLPGVIVEVLQHEGGTLEFHDESKPTPFSADIVPITFTLLNFSTRPDSADALSFMAEIGPGEKIEWHGAVHIQPLDSEGRLSVTGLKARTLWSYIQDRINFEFLDGVIDLTVYYRARSTPEAFQASLSEGSIKITELAVGEKGFRERLIVVPEFAIEGIEADLATREARVGEIRSRDARITGWIERDGSTSFQRLFAGEKQPPTAPPQPQTPAAPAATPWLIKINQVNIEKYGIVLEDRKPATPVRLSVNPLTIKLANVSSRLDSKFAMDAAARVNDTGTVAVKGDVIADPLTLNLDLDVAGIAFAPFQPYLDEIARVNLKSGSAWLRGHLAYGPQQGTKPKMRFDGTAGVMEFHTQDTMLNKDLLKWNSLAFNSIGLELDPTSISITEIVATKPYIRFIIAPDRTTNLHQVLSRPDSSAQTQEPPIKETGSEKPPPQQPVPVRIGVIRIVDGSAHFADFSLKPLIDTGIFSLNGTIKGLSSKELSKAEVSINGKVDKYAPMAIKGRINPLTSDAFTDIGTTFKNVELTTVSPYSTKFAGYPIIKGKISLDLRYKLSKKVLEAENNVVIEQLTLGERIEGPDATSLPVKLAIALLKDRNGVIDIKLPVRGDLNNPDFKYGKLLLDVLINLVTKAVTSPFNLVAGLVGGSGEELSAVDFQVGTTALLPDEENKLKTLTKALAERPGLRLDVAGAAGEDDRAALAEQNLNRELLALKSAGSIPAGKPVAAGEDFSRLPEAEQAELIKTLYLKKYGKLPEPTSPPGQTDKPAPASTQALKDRLLGDIVIDDGEIRRLAQERGKHIQNYLISQGGVQPERIYMLDVKLDAKGKDGIVASKLSLNAE